jgi:hypothetical protein
MQYFVHRNNVQLGPFTEADIKAQLASGTLSTSDHVWWQGQQGWVPLSQTALVAGAVPPIVAPVAPGMAPAYVPIAPTGATSQLAIWALVCGCVSFLCGFLASIPAVVLGHLALGQIKRNPGLQGKGMALAGLIIGYIISVVTIAYVIFMLTMFGSITNQVKTTFDTINAQLKQAEATNGMNSPDTSTNSSDQSTTNAPDQSTNSAPASPPPDSTTNAPATNAAPASQ